MQEQRKVIGAFVVQERNKREGLKSKTIQLSKPKRDVELLIFVLSHFPLIELMEEIVTQNLKENEKLFILKYLLGLSRGDIICLMPLDNRGLEILMVSGIFREKSARKIKIAELDKYIQNKNFPIFYKGIVMEEWKDIHLIF